MVLWRGGRRRFAFFAAVAVAGPLMLGPTAAAAAPAPAPAPHKATPHAAPVPLPALPSVPLSITDGVPAKTLLANALTLASVGVDGSAQQAAIAITQAALVKDNVLVAQMKRQAARATTRARANRQTATKAQVGYSSLDGALKKAVLRMYVNGSNSLTVNPDAGPLLAYAIDYADTTVTPNGILSVRRYDSRQQHQATVQAKKNERTAQRDAAKAAKALAAAEAQHAKLLAEIASLSALSKAAGAEVAADHTALASQAGTELVSGTSLEFKPKSRLPHLLSTTAVALTWAFAELGKSYVWGATGPNTFDCSGLTQYVWHQAGVAIPRVAADQDAWTVPVPLSQLLPGDLVFFGRTDIHHVGIYIGDGLMINAPHTGDVVRVSPIWWSDLAGFGRVHAPGTPVPLHQPPSISDPAAPAVVATAGLVPSQTKPPPGWKPKPGETTPIRLPTNPSTTTTTTSTTVAPTTSTSDTTSTTATTLPDTTTTLPDTTTTVPDTTTTTVPDTSTTVPGSSTSAPAGTS
jgi:cell wall-associated NlpC family hydrolase